MRHDPIVCPKCGAPFDPEALLKTRRTRAAAVAEAVAEPVVAEEEIDAAIAARTCREPPEATQIAARPRPRPTAEGEEAEEAEEEEEEVLEDASELGEDEDDMAEVIENVDEDEER